MLIAAASAEQTAAFFFKDPETSFFPFIFCLRTAKGYIFDSGSGTGVEHINHPLMHRIVVGRDGDHGRVSGEDGGLAIPRQRMLQIAHIPFLRIGEFSAVEHDGTVAQHFNDLLVRHFHALGLRHLRGKTQA